MSESAKDRAAREAAEQRKRQVEALENEKAGLKQRIAGSTDDAEKARLESRVKQVDESISFHKKAPAGRSTSGSSST